MKKQILFLSLLLGGPGVAAQTPPPGVIGINTENPRGVLHIDGASTTATANPSTGTVSADQATDDVIVDAQGRIGIGHIAPEAKIDIRSDAPGAIRIQDTTEGQGKALTSDAYGTGSWGIFPSVGESWYAALYDGQLLEYSAGGNIRGLSNYVGSLIIPGGGGAVDATAGSITLPRKGRYRIMISVYWDCNRSGVTQYLTRAVLCVGGSSRQTFSIWGGNSGGANGVLSSFVSIRNLDEGDVLSLATDETAANSANRAQAVLFFVELVRPLQQ